MTVQISPGPGERVTYQMNPNGGPNIVTRERIDPAAQRVHEAAVKQARERWTDAEAAGRKAVAALSGARQREAGFRLAVKYGLL